MKEGDAVIRVLKDEFGLRETLIRRGDRELVIVDLLSPLPDGFYPFNQSVISGLANGHKRYEIWIEGKFFTDYGSDK